MARETFHVARIRLLKELSLLGWTVKTKVQGSFADLKTPHATHPHKELKLWFHPQAVYVSRGPLGPGHSLMVDTRGLSASQLVERAVMYDSLGHDSPFSVKPNQGT